MITVHNKNYENIILWVNASAKTDKITNDMASTITW